MHTYTNLCIHSCLYSYMDCYPSVLGTLNIEEILLKKRFLFPD